jgi:hypothetical protein
MAHSYVVLLTEPKKLVLEVGLFTTKPDAKAYVEERQ